MGFSVESWFDGSCEPVNPLGHASYGCVVKKEGRILFEHSGYIGHGEGMSNNVAEYCGIIEVMKFLLRENLAESVIYGDSKLVVMQMNHRWKAKGGLYLPYFKEAMVLRRQLPNAVIKWIPRALNEEADYLSRQANRSVPRSAKKHKQLVKLIKQQKAEMKQDRWNENSDRWNRFDHALFK